MPNDSLPTAPSGEEQTECSEQAERLVSDYCVATFMRSGGKEAGIALRAYIAHLEALSTERARMERERDERFTIEEHDAAILAERASWERQADAWGTTRLKLEDEVSRLTSELDRVRGALAKYGEHGRGCWSRINPAAACNCGLKSALGLSTVDATTRREG